MTRMWSYPWVRYVIPPKRNVSVLLTFNEKSIDMIPQDGVSDRATTPPN